MPANVPASIALRCFVFQCLEAMSFKTLSPHFCEGVENIRMALPCSVALAFFAASYFRWRCACQLLSPLYGANGHFKLIASLQLLLRRHGASVYFVSRLSRIAIKIILQTMTKLDVFKLTNRRLVLVTSIAKTMLWLQWRCHNIRERAVAATA